MAGRSLSLFLMGVFATLIGSISGVSVNEPCGSSPAVVSNFDLPAYTGTWYELYRYSNFFQGNADCVTSEVYLQASEVNIRLYNRMVVLSPEWTPADSTMTGMLSFPNASPIPGSFNVSRAEDYSTANYLILATDYENYSIVLSCMDTSATTSEQWAWVFSRTYYMRPAVEAEVEAAIDEHLVRSLLRETNHDDSQCLGGEISPGGFF